MEDGRTRMRVDAWLAAYAREDVSPPGVVATYDRSGGVLAIEAATCVETALRAARARKGGGAGEARVMAFRNPATATRENLAAEARRWREACGVDETDGVTVPGADVGRGGVVAAVRDGDDDADESRGRDASRGAAVSPFATARAGAVAMDAVGRADAPTLELTMENVDAALDEVRPYLIADGGNVELVTIDDGMIVVRLNGACGTCASSTATMKGGIEKLLKQKFGAAVDEVVNVSGDAEEMTVETLEAHLEKLRKSIASYGGEVSVESLDSRGICILRFKGPQALAFSIAQALKQKFPLVRECKIRQVN